MKTKGIKTKRNKIFKKDQLEMMLLALPAVLVILVMRYIPMAGVMIAFKNYKYNLGILGSEWVGFDNFVFFFKSNDAALVIRNALAYNTVFIITGNMIAITMAILLTYLGKKAVGFIQNAMFQPYILSWVVVAFVSLVFLSYKNGVFNSVAVSLGGEKISWYGEPKYWPFILWFFHMWKGLGYQVLIYYTTIINIDTDILDAAKVDGCNAVQTAYKIIVPIIKPTVTVLVILAIGGIFNSDFGLFYQIPQASGALKKVTDVVETYTYRTLTVAGNAGVSAAVGFAQGVVGMILVLMTNAITKRYDKENALF